MGAAAPAAAGDRRGGQRFVQAGRCVGWIRAGGREIRLRAGEWTGTRGRGWGVRPLPGEDGGRFAGEYPAGGLRRVWCPVRCDDRFLMVIVQEDADGGRALNDATVVRPDHPDRRLGPVRPEIAYRPGTRHPERALIRLGDPREPLELDVEVLTSAPLTPAAGRPPAGDRRHRGDPGRRAHDLTGPAARPLLAAPGVTGHAARFRPAGETGYGIFEHGVPEHGTRAHGTRAHGTRAHGSAGHGLFGHDLFGHRFPGRHGPDGFTGSDSGAQ
ncbi:hypothetical protein GCM10020295_69480 [Streptomyces cinereospinus]